MVGFDPRRRKHTQYPREDISDSGKDSGGGEEDAEITHPHGSAGRKENVADGSNGSQESNHKSSLLESIGDPGSSNDDEEREEVRRGRKTLCINGCEAHILEDGREEDGERGKADVAAEVHKLNAVSLVSPMQATYRCDPRLSI